MANSVVPYMSNPNHLGSIEETGSPVVTSCRFAQPVVAIISERDHPERTGNQTPNADPIELVTAEVRRYMPSAIRVPLNFNDMHALLRNPLPVGAGRINCYIRRNKAGANRSRPIYTMFTEDGNRFLMSARKVARSFVITSHTEEVSKRPDIFLAEIKTNFLGTEHQIIDDVHGPQSEQGVVVWNTKSTFADTPRRVEVALPSKSPLLPFQFCL